MMKTAGIFVRNNFKIILTLVAFFLAYFPTILWMWDRWWARDSYYSHGILVPFVSAFLIWQKWDDLKKMKCLESPWGMRLIILGLAIHFLSSLFRVYFSSGFSMLVVFIGLVLYFFGSAILKKIFFPVMFLLFMIPLPMVAITGISFRLKIFAAELSTAVLNNMGILAVREGSLIKMRHAYVVVDDVCSGLRSLISLTALGSIFAYWLKIPVVTLAATGSVFAYWLKGPMPKRIFIFLSTIPIAIVTNMCRVVVLSVISEIWGVEYATGFVHDATGFLVFALAFIMLYAVVKIIE